MLQIIIYYKCVVYTFLCPNYCKGGRTSPIENMRIRIESTGQPLTIKQYSNSKWVDLMCRAYPIYPYCIVDTVPLLDPICHGVILVVLPTTASTDVSSNGRITSQHVNYRVTIGCCSCSVCHIGWGARWRRERERESFPCSRWISASPTVKIIVVCCCCCFPHYTVGASTISYSIPTLCSFDDLIQIWSGITRLSIVSLKDHVDINDSHFGSKALVASHVRSERWPRAFGTCPASANRVRVCIIRGKAWVVLLDTAMQHIYIMLFA